MLKQHNNKSVKAATKKRSSTHTKKQHINTKAKKIVKKKSISSLQNTTQRTFATIVESPTETGIVHPSQVYAKNEYDTPLDRVKGNFPTFYRNAVLTKVLTDLTSTGGPITFFNITGANIAHQLKESHLHKDATYLYKWLRLPIGLRRIPRGIDSLKPWLKQFAAANEDVPVDGFGFPKDLYLPGSDYIASRILRPQDKHIIFETRQEMIDLASLAFKDDPRVEINTTGLYQESDLKELIPCKGRAVVYVDLHESSSYEQQARARNAIRGIMKRLPHSAFIVTYPLVEDFHPWEVLDLFASTGMHVGYGTSQFSDDMATERDMVKAIQNDQILTNETAIQLHKTGIKPRPIFDTWTPFVSDSNDLPDSIEFFRPRNYWSGAGAMVFNVGQMYGQTLTDIGDALRSATGKPMGMRYGRSGPLYEPNSYEVGTGWGHKQSFQIPGISIPEDYLYMTTDEIQENMDNRLVDEMMDKIDYIPMKGGPTNLYDISKEQFRLTKHGKRLVEDDDVVPKSRKEWGRRTPLGVYNNLMAFARTQDLKEFKNTFKTEWSMLRDGKEYKHSKLHGRPGRFSQENAPAYLDVKERFGPTMWENENYELSRSSYQEREGIRKDGYQAQKWAGPMNVPVKIPWGNYIDTPSREEVAAEAAAKK